MTTLDHFAAHPTRRFHVRSLAMTITALALLALGAIALMAPPTVPSDEWHGNVAVSAPH
ncbi:MAG: hypothetical protein AAFW87_11105 [Pseudomonadota bacterium]